MYSKKTLERFSNPSYAGGLRGADATGKGELGNEVVKIYITVDEDGMIDTAKFKAYGGVCTIVASDIACEIIEGKSLEHALTVNANEIMDEIDDECREDSCKIVEEAIKDAVEDYYKKKEKELKKANK
ncbi:MAG: iron-sulfur cluster assembly scaffold protein [Clostridia bacterium]|nr:iron-sulfur cluster assembly scaffold protein [Clostridia bacterium]